MFHVKVEPKIDIDKEKIKQIAIPLAIGFGLGVVATIVVTRGAIKAMGPNVFVIKV